MKLGSGYDLITVNDYPSRQSSTNRMGQLAHSHTGLFTIVTQTTNGGRRLQNNGKWTNVSTERYWIACNVADIIEILTDGKYKAVVHRVILNSDARRVTPPLFMDAFVRPAPEFVDDSHPPGYLAMTSKRYLELNGYRAIGRRSWLQPVRPRVLIIIN